MDRSPRRVLALTLVLVAAGCAQAPGPPTAASSRASASVTAPPVSASAATPPASSAPSPTTPPDRVPAPTAPAPRAPSRAAGADLDDPGSSAVVVNKRRPLVPADWAPPALEDVEGHLLRPEAAEALRGLLAAARSDGVRVRVVSGYRSYAVQETTYAGWVARMGQEGADAVSARPGHSEHQTGLAVDVGDGGPCDLSQCFADTPAGQWVADHGPEHGFVVRYPPGEQATTGYAYEPWHLRYLGPDRAQEFVRSGSGTLEEFWGLDPAPDYGTPAPG